MRSESENRVDRRLYQLGVRRVRQDELMQSNAEVKGKSKKVRDGLRVAKNAYKAHKIHIYALQNKLLKQKLKKLESENDAVSVISDTDTLITETMASENKTYGTVDWQELSEISQEKRQRLQEIYGGPSTTQEMDIPSEEEFQAPRRTAKPRVETTRNQVTLTNKYGALEKQSDQENTSIPTVQQPKKKWVPPIVVNSAIVDYKKFITNVTETLGHNRFTIKLNRNTSKIFLQEEQDRNKLLQDFEKTNIQCHSYPLMQERTKKLVLKAAPGLNPEELANTLKDNQLRPTAVQELRGKSNLSHS